MAANPVNVGIIGCGHVSHQYFEGCARFQVLRMAACADLEVRRAEQRALKYGIPKTCSAMDLLADPGIDLIINLTPPLAHAEISYEALRAGKHVWSEKPLATNLADAVSLVDAARDANVLLGCAPDTFLGGGLQTSRKVFDDGQIGDPVAAVAFVSEHGYEHFHPNVDHFYGPGGGPARDLGPYYITGLINLLGPVVRVTGLAHATFPERTIHVGHRLGERIPVQIPTHVTGALEFESGVLATLLMSWDIWATHLPYVEIYGTTGSLSLPNPDEFGGAPLLRIADDEELTQPPPAPGSLRWEKVSLTHDGSLGRGIGVADMAYSIRGRRQHRASGELALHVLEILLGVERSADEGNHIDIASRCERPAPWPLGRLEGNLD